MTIHERLCFLLEDTGKKRNKVSEKIGISPATLSNYITGSSKIPHDIVARLAEYFGVTTDYLLCLTEVPNVPMRLNTEEEQIISDYRSLRREYQSLTRKHLHDLLDLEYHN